MLLSDMKLINKIINFLNFPRRRKTENFMLLHGISPFSFGTEAWFIKLFRHYKVRAKMIAYWGGLNIKLPSSKKALAVKEIINSNRPLYLWLEFSDLKWHECWFKRRQIKYNY